jgi:hypothetical protein
VSDALTAPFLIAALVLAVAGIQKVRSPAGAARALAAAGMPAPASLVRGFGLLEISLAVLCAVRPSAVTAGALACAYAGFAGLGILLARRAVVCGCFGDDDAPASVAQALLSAALAIVALAAALHPPHGTGWVLERSPAVAGVLVIGVLGAVEAIVLAYTQLPRAWTAWSPR